MTRCPRLSFLHVLCLVVLPVLLVLPACSSGGGGSDSGAGNGGANAYDSTPPSSPQPVADSGIPGISNLRLSSTRIPWTTGSVTITGAFDFTDAGGDVSAFTLTTFDPSADVIPNTPDALPNLSGVTAGTINITTRISPAVRGNYSFQISVKDKGGLESQKLTDKFTLVPESDPWTTRAPMPTARAGLATAVIDGKLYAVGGYDSANEYAGNGLNTVERYDPATDKWTTLKPMPTPRLCLAAGAVNGKLYAIGGFNHDSLNLRTVEEYDPAADTWSTRAVMPTARSDLQVAVYNDRIYAIGGRADRNDIDLRSVEEYDPVTDSWTVKKHMAAARYAPVVGVANGRIYAMSGLNEGGFADTVEEYDPATDTWITQPGNMPTNQVSSWGVSIDGAIYAIGGSMMDKPTNEHQPTNIVEQYAPVTGAWTAWTPMPTARLDLAAEVIDGKIYVIGGIETGDTVSNKLEVYDPGQDL